MRILGARSDRDAPARAARRPLVRWNRLCAPLLWLLVASGDVAAEPAWRPVSDVPFAPPVLAVAGSPRRLAVADARGVWLGPAAGGRGMRRIQRVEGVRDLALERGRALWVAGDEGLRRVALAGPAAASAAEEREAPGSAARAVALAPGDDARRVHRVVVAGPLRLAASDAGVFASAAGRTGAGLHGPAGWRRLPGWPSGPATALAVVPTGGEPAGLRLATVVGGEAWHARLDGDGRIVDRPRPLGATAARRGEVVDVAPARDGTDPAWWLLLRDGCLLRAPATAHAARRCRGVPPGVEARRLVVAPDGAWLVTDRGLLGASRPGSTWTRAAPPVGTLAGRALAVADGRIWLAAERGLYLGERAGAFGAGSASGTPSAGRRGLPAPREDLERREPGVDAVRRAALAHLELGPARLRRLRRGAERRGWLPEVTLRLDHDSVVDRRDDFDEAFISGDFRSLFDRQHDRRRGFEASLSLSWDLGDVLHHPESVDASREVRELIELRDDVLDEIHQLYFERRRVLLELWTLEPDRPREAARLRLRADELAAGIDAWTGGWFGRHALRLSR